MKQLRIGLVYSVLVLGGFLIYKFLDKDSLMQAIERSLPEREAGVLVGMILGERQAMSKEFYEWLKISGLVHLVVVSGSNVMLLSKGLIEGLAGYLGRKKTIVAVMVLAWNYAAMVGWEIPVLRAVLLISIYYWAQLWGRVFNIWRALGLTVLMMVLADKSMVGEISFWLSVLAFVAVVTGKGLNVFWMTLWVNLWVTPILAISFGKISLISPLTNVMVMFLVGTITILGFFGAVMGIFWWPMGRGVLWLTYPLLKYFVWVVEWGSKAVSTELRFNWSMLVGWYLILGWWWMRRGNAK